MAFRRRLSRNENNMVKSEIRRIETQFRGLWMDTKDETGEHRLHKYVADAFRKAGAPGGCMAEEHLTGIVEIRKKAGLKYP